jgi:hypothetical protein
MTNNEIANRLPEAPETRRTVIPTPRNAGLFGGWGVKF